MIKHSKSINVPNFRKFWLDFKILKSNNVISECGCPKKIPDIGQISKKAEIEGMRASFY